MESLVNQSEPMHLTATDPALSKHIKPFLLRGDLTTIAERHSVSRAYVSAVLRKGKIGSRVWASLVELAAANKALIEENKAKTQNLSINL